MSDTEKEVTEEVAMEPVDDSDYAPTETRVVTPEQAAHEVVDRTPESAVDHRGEHVAITTNMPENRRFEGDYVVEEMPENEESFPISESGEAYTATVETEDNDFGTAAENTDDLKKA